jgi:multiple sugar transport system permease protein
MPHAAVRTDPPASLADRIAARRLGRRLRPYILVFPAMAVLGLFFAAPAVYNIALSFQRVSLFELGEGGTWVGLANFSELLDDSAILDALWNTAFWLTFVTVVTRLVLGLALALLLNASVFQRWHLTGLTRSLLLLPWVTPQVVAVAAWSWLLEPRFGAINQLLLHIGVIDQRQAFLAKTSTVWPAVEVILVWRELPFVVIAFLAGLQSIPTELKEAARVDGASELRVLRSVTLPLLKPVIAVVALLTTIWTFNNFVYVWLTTRGGPGDYTQVLATRVYAAAFIDYRFGMAAAIGVFMSAIMLVFAIGYFFLVFRERER